MKFFPPASIHGRFQILHLDHYRYFRLAADRYGHLYIGLTGQKRHVGSSGRLALAMNPLSYWERVEMWRRLIQDAHPKEEHLIGPFPIEEPEQLCDFVPKTCVCTTTVREAWNEEKVRRLENLGYRVDVLDRNLDKAITATDIRNMIVSGSSDWKDLVPRSVSDFLESLEIRSRLLSIEGRAVPPG